MTDVPGKPRSQLRSPYLAAPSAQVSASRRSADGRDQIKPRLFSVARADGAMIYVVVEELIPEAHRDGNVDLATVSLIDGVRGDDGPRVALG